MAADTATDVLVVLSRLKDRGIPLASVKLMIDVSDGPHLKLVDAMAEFMRDDITGAKWLVVRPKPAGA